MSYYYVTKLVTKLINANYRSNYNVSVSKTIRKYSMKVITDWNRACQEKNI